MHGLMSERQDVPTDVAEILPEVMTTLLARAAARGEIRLGKVTPRIAAVPGDLLRHQLLLAQQPASHAVLAEIVDDIFGHWSRRSGERRRVGAAVQEN